MELYKKVPVTFKDSTYEIRVYYSDVLINIVTFKDNHPANGFRHQIQISQKCDVTRILDSDLLDEIIEISKKDITEGRAKKLSDLIQENT